MITPYSNIISVTTLEVLLLDTYSGAAAAYSLRRLRTAYTGSAIRVRRSSDNTEQDIGFVNNVLDTSTLTSFCSGTNGFVKTWYDQSGNGRDATQSTASAQPQIVTSGSVILENGKPSVQFDGSDDRFFMPTIAFNMNSISVMVVSKSDSVLSGGIALAHPDPLRIYAGFITSSVEYFGYNDAATKFNLGIANTNQSLKELYAGSSTTNAYKNTTPSTSVSSVSNAASGINWSIGSYRGGTPVINSNFYDGNIQEIILYLSDQSSNRTGIEDNINDFYSIY